MLQTSSSGKASYTFRPTRTTAWKLVLAENIATAPYTAGSSTPVKTITVT